MSARFFLYFGWRRRFCFGSGITRSGGTVPTRSRALALTAFTMEKRRFFGLGIGIRRTCGGVLEYEILYRKQGRVRPETEYVPSGDAASIPGGDTRWKSGISLTNGRSSAPTS